MITASLDQAFYRKLRKIRMFHYAEVLRLRNEALRHDMAGSDVAVSRKLNAKADEHIHHVQTLNFFFVSPGDTAERDIIEEEERCDKTKQVFNDPIVNEHALKVDRWFIKGVPDRFWREKSFAEKEAANWKWPDEV